jgi:hypothetical protein
MKEIRALGVVVVMLGIALAGEASPQRGTMGRGGGGGWGPGTPYGRLYNPQTVETITGEVVSVDKITPMKGMSYGIHLQVKTDKGMISVHLGPSWYIENQDVKIEPKDKIDVKGSLITFEGKPTLIAAEVKKGNEVLILRDSNGLPVWSGWRRR